MIKYKNKDGYIFEVVENSIHHDILKNDSDWEEVKGKTKKA